MTITLSSDQESFVNKQLEAGRFHSVIEVIDSALHALEQTSSVVLRSSPEVEESIAMDHPPPKNLAKKNFAQFLCESPLRGSGLNLETQKEYPRAVEL